MMKVKLSKKLNNIEPIGGNSYYSKEGIPEFYEILPKFFRSLSITSIIILENNIPLPGPSNALHENIRNLGEGRYSIWTEQVIFSSTDNSDPRFNGQQYVIKYRLNFWGMLYQLCFRYVLMRGKMFTHLKRIYKSTMPFFLF